jgi:hypothetical protein
MKKLLLTTILGLAGLFQVPGIVSAGDAFGLFTCGCCRKCGCEVCIRPYNAFTPVLCGTICADNCFPSCGNQCGCGPMGYGMQGQMPPGPMVPMAPVPPQMMPGQMAPELPQGYPSMPGQMAPSLNQSIPGAVPEGAEKLPAPKAPQPLPEPMASPGNNMVPSPMPRGPAMTRAYPGMMPYGMVQPVGYYPVYYPCYWYGYGYAPMMPTVGGYYNPAAR